MSTPAETPTSDQVAGNPPPKPAAPAAKKPNPFAAAKSEREVALEKRVCTLEDTIAKLTGEPKAAPPAKAQDKPAAPAAEKKGWLSGVMAEAKALGFE